MTCKPSAPLIISCVALFFSATGAGLAARHYLITSTSQIKPSVLKQLETPGPQGLPGPQGPQGPQGATGRPGPWVGVDTEQTQITIPAGQTGDATANCPPATSATGGGESGTVSILSNGPSSNLGAFGQRLGWTVTAQNTTSQPQTLTAYVECMP